MSLVRISVSLLSRVAAAFYPFTKHENPSDDLFNGKHQAGLAGLNPVSGRERVAQKAPAPRYFPPRSLGAGVRLRVSWQPATRPAGPPPRTTIWVNVANSCRRHRHRRPIFLRHAWRIGFEAYTVASEFVRFAAMFPRKGISSKEIKPGETKRIKSCELRCKFFGSDRCMLSRSRAKCYCAAVHNPFAIPSPPSPGERHAEYCKCDATSYEVEKMYMDVPVVFAYFLKRTLERFSLAG